MKKIKNIAVIVFLLFVVFVTIIDIRGSFLEYKELGERYISIFTTNIKYKYCIVGINFIILFCIMYMAGRKINKGLKEFFNQEKKTMPKFPNKLIALVVSVIVSIIIGNIITPKILLFLNKADFVKTDGVFNLDISFFMFIEPVLKFIITYMIGICIGLIIYLIIYSIIVFNKYFDGIDKDTLKYGILTKNIIRYIRFIAIEYAVFNFIKVLDIVFDNFITTNSGLQLVGAGFTDITIKVIGNVLLSVIIVFAVFMATSYFKKGKFSNALKNILLVPAYMVLMFFVVFGYDLIFVNSNKYDKEKQYIERNIAYTKNAYNISNDYEVIEYTGTITEEEILQNKDLIDNAVIISKKIALDTLNEEQTEKGYYTYKTAGIFEYNNKFTYLSPKEISNVRRTYNSKTYEYTHGYGVILTNTSETTEDGETKQEMLELVTPQIYYGLETNNTVIINKDSKVEYDYTDNKGNEYNSTYNGNSGVNLSFIDRFILGLKKGTPTIAFSGNVKNESIILINRNIIQRAKLALSSPNIIYDENPYMVATESGNLFWVIDGFTISDTYPYAKYIIIQNNREKRRVNYIRNSVKVIINAYNGEMKFYLTDDTDPIAVSFRKMYPDLFENKDSKIPDEIAKHIVYPEFLYNIQASVIEEYHNVKPEVLYRGDDSWNKVSYITTQNNKTVNNTLNAYYTSVKQNGNNKVGLIQMYTQKGKQNLNSYLIGTVVDGVNNLKIYKLSSSETILGLTQLDNKISQDEGISSEIEKLNVIGAKVTKSMMVIPVDKTLLYIEQIYQTKTNESNIPKLKIIIVASGNKVAYGKTLEEAIANLASQSATRIDTYTVDDIDGLIQSIIKANNNLTQSMNSKDLELIGSDVKKLQELINCLEREREKQKEVEKGTDETEEMENTNFIEENEVIE